MDIPISTFLKLSKTREHYTPEAYYIIIICHLVKYIGFKNGYFLFLHPEIHSIEDNYLKLTQNPCYLSLGVHYFRYRYLAKKSIQLDYAIVQDHTLEIEICHK